MATDNSSDSSGSQRYNSPLDATSPIVAFALGVTPLTISGQGSSSHAHSLIVTGTVEKRISRFRVQIIDEMELENGVLSFSSTFEKEEINMPPDERPPPPPVPPRDSLFVSLATKFKNIEKC